MYISRRLRWISIVIASFLGSLLLWSNGYAQSAAVVDLKPILLPVLQQADSANVPLQLPGSILDESPYRGISTDPPLYAVAKITTDPQGYQIVLGYSPTCDGGNSCRAGTIVGFKRTTSTPLEQQYQDDTSKSSRVSPEPAGDVSLAGGHQGWFSPWSCGVNCSDAVVAWDDGDYRYAVSVKMGSRDQLVEMANSAINNEGG